MRQRRVWKKLLGLGRAVIEDVFLEQEALIIAVRAKAREQGRCPYCGQRSAGYDLGDGRRRWRAIDFANHAPLLGGAPRVRCKVHGVVVAAVPWARHRSWFTIAFEDQVAWLAVHTNKTAVSELMRISLRAVGTVIERVAAEGLSGRDMLAGLSRIGIDELQLENGHSGHKLVAGRPHVTGAFQRGQVEWAVAPQLRPSSSGVAGACNRRTGVIRLQVALEVPALQRDRRRIPAFLNAVLRPPGVRQDVDRSSQRSALAPVTDRVAPEYGRKHAWAAR